MDRIEVYQAVGDYCNPSRINAISEEHYLDS
jgi:hypothetical protein